MIGSVLIGLFLLALLAGMPLATGLGVASIAVLAMAAFDQLAVPTNIYAGIAKYPLLALPMFVLVGSNILPFAVNPEAPEPFRTTTLPNSA